MSTKAVVQAPDMYVNLDGHGEGDGRAPAVKKHPSKKFAPKVLGKKRGIVYDDSNKSNEDQQGQFICVFQGKENEMHVFLSDFLNAVIFAGPLNLSQSSEEAKVVPKTKDVTKMKGSSKSRVIIQDN